ncbi:glycoside hydrolase family 2 TIM barrel-domain containing protein [Arenibacter sp. M-2]|uniref:glycoside hydrolase family 2 protein n=1 Tax=unclassified Arenibacter TaxID=2615047 RepID=UPI000D758D5A|nr:MULTISPECIES: glycoside hydrolase family 2 TIM barrel-domain containing protein [unclassified Arenibacter]MDL5510419.1 glycoside hydrolase family 2 TIM barrel-domain containing protein [Arenibacter sp. M-2]PXX31287.1 exo-1,4-beta-D-glucosaminidase [Arenibacter sp. ARW7G5Y1]
MQKSFQIKLSDNWRIQSSKKVSEKGSEISTKAIISEKWFPAVVPSTVLSTLVANKVYENPYFGENLKTIPTDLFKVSWWYTTSFELTKEQSDGFASLKFDGINYKANVWLNGQLIADATAIDGAFRITSFDVSTHIKGGSNILAIEVIPPQPGDFSIGFVDWNPAPPDGDMGVFRPVTLHLHGGVQIEKPFVQTKVDLETLKEADITVSAELMNHSNTEISGKLVGTIGALVFQKNISLAPKNKELIIFDSEEFVGLNLKEPKLWWPINLGNPDLYDLDLKFVAKEEVLDETNLRFGIRDIQDYWLNDIHRGYKVNGQKVLIKGGGWTDDMLLMDTDESIEAQVKYVKQMNLNCIRLEGFWGKDHKLYDLCDEHGLLLMVGWSCHWEHEIHMGVPVNERFGGVYKPEHISHVAQAWEDQVIWLRNHPSIFVWTVASDKVPITELEQRYIDTFAKYDPTRPYLNSTGGVGSDQHVIGSEDVISEISGSSGVKMLGPYAYTAPVYWFTDTKFGGAYGFNTETGPGAQIPQLESLKKMIPSEQLWPIGEAWNFHCGRYEFADLSRFTKAIEEKYGAPSSLEEFDKKAQAMNYELMRPMFEAFQVHKKKSTGIIQWMLNAAWPKMYWQLYDYYLNPTAAFYATQKACLPLGLIYNYGDKQIYAVNDHLRPVENLSAHVRVYSIGSEILFENKVQFTMDPDSSKSILALGDLKGLTTTYFVDLRLLDEQGSEIGNNFYWLSKKEEVLDYEADLGPFAFHTPSKVYADFTPLNGLPEVQLEQLHYFEQDGDQQNIKVELKNNSDHIAFLVNLKVLDKKSGELILPIFWEDNFINLLPGEERTVCANFIGTAEATLKVEGWNLK